MPKSPSPALPSAASQTLSGLTSRWTTPCACAWASASASARPVRSTSATSRPPARGGGEPVRERAAGHEARDDVQRAVVLDGVVDRDDVRVVAEARHQARLVAHALARLGAGGARAGACDRDRAVERQVVGEPDLLRAAAAEQALRQVAPGDQPHRRVRRSDGRHGQSRRDQQAAGHSVAPAASGRPQLGQRLGGSSGTGVGGEL